jgi:hypothetical protein
MDEGRKRVLGIMAAILASKLIAASVQWAQAIMEKIDAYCGN